MTNAGKLYRFSPISETSVLLDAVEYVTKEATKMIFRNEGYTLPIENVTIFAHYASEYDKLIKLLADLGIPSKANNGVRATLTNPIVTLAMKIEINGELQDINHTVLTLRIRKPDPYRMQVGCCDFEYDGEYERLATSASLASENIRRIQRSDIDMIEFCDPDFDVLAYVVK